MNECQTIWRKFVVPQSVWDLWEVRKVFIDVYGYPVEFTVATDSRGEIIGALPVWWNSREERWEWISDQWAEGNYPLADNQEVVREMLGVLRGKVFLDAIRQDKKDLFGQGLERDADHFGFSIGARGGTWDGIWSSMPSRRENVRRNIKSLEGMRPKVVTDREGDLENLFALNILRMREKAAKYSDEERSVYENGDNDRRAIRQLWQRGRDGIYRSRILAVEVKSKVVGVMFNLAWQDKYVQLHRGEDVHSADGIGSYMNKLVVEDALRLGCDYVDFCMEEHHWKSNWCQGEPTYKLQRGEI